jgi:alkylhydroperoxidase family enzyme
LLTEVPWAIDTDDIDRLRNAKISEESIEQAILIASYFNYFPRVADGVGIELDYESPLPRFSVDSLREALPRLPMDDWNPSVNGSTLPSFPGAPQVTDLLRPWRILHFERIEPIGQTTRVLLARIVAEELCDAAALGPWKDATPTNDVEKNLVSFARKLTRTPWAMTLTDCDELRTAGLSDDAILAAITLIGHQNAISRMHHALAAVRK